MSETAYVPEPARSAIPAGSPRTLREALPIFWRHASPLVLAAALAGAIAVRAALGGWSAWDLAPVAAVVVLWPLQEWLIHVYVLHFRPRTFRGRTIDFRVPRKHRAHHRDPWNYEILFIPLQSYLYSLPLLVALWYLVTPNPRLAWTGIAAHLALALHYESVHFLIHTRVQPRTRFYRRLWRNHRLHHFKNEHHWFGVSRLEADWLLGTAADVDRVAPSPSVRHLYGKVDDPERTAS